MYWVKNRSLILLVIYVISCCPIIISLRDLYNVYILYHYCQIISCLSIIMILFIVTSALLLLCQLALVMGQDNSPTTNPTPVLCPLSSCQERNASCSSNPCDMFSDAQCPRFQRATCCPNYCGGCFATWKISNTEDPISIADVTDHCNQSKEKIFSSDMSAFQSASVT